MSSQNGKTDVFLSSFQLNKYTGRWVKWQAFVDEFMSNLGFNSKTNNPRRLASEYFKLDLPLNPAPNPDKLVTFPARWTLREVPDFLEEDPAQAGSTLAQRNTRSDLIERLESINTPILDAKSAGYSILSSMCSSDLVASFQKHSDEPWYALRVLRESVGDLAAGSTRETDAVASFLDLKMQTDERFTQAMIKFKQYATQAEASDRLRLSVLISLRTSNQGERQFVAPRLGKDVIHCISQNFGFNAAEAYLAQQDAMYWSLKDLRKENGEADNKPKNDKSKTKLVNAVSKKPHPSTKLKFKNNTTTPKNLERESESNYCLNCGGDNHKAKSCSHPVCGYCEEDDHKSCDCHHRKSDQKSGKYDKKWSTSLRKTYLSNRQSKADGQEEQVQKPQGSSRRNHAGSRRNRASDDRSIPVSQITTLVNQAVMNAVKKTSTQDLDVPTSDSDEDDGDEDWEANEGHVAAVMKPLRKPLRKKLRRIQAIKILPRRMPPRVDQAVGDLLIVADTGAQRSVTGGVHHLSTITKTYGKSRPELTSASGHAMIVSHVGELNQYLRDFCVVDGISEPLASVRQMQEDGLGLYCPPRAFLPSRVGGVIFDSKAQIIGVCTRNMRFSKNSLKPTGVFLDLPSLTELDVGLRHREEGAAQSRK